MVPHFFNIYPYTEKVITHPAYDYIYLSPHLDDVVFSCSGNIYCHRQKGLHTLIVTFFTADPHPPFSSLAQDFHDLWQVPEEDPYGIRKKDTYM